MRDWGPRDWNLERKVDAIEDAVEVLREGIEGTTRRGRMVRLGRGSLESDIMMVYVYVYVQVSMGMVLQVDGWEYPGSIYSAVFTYSRLAPSI